MFILRLWLPRRSLCREHALFESHFSQSLFSPAPKPRKVPQGGGGGHNTHGGAGRRGRCTHGHPGGCSTQLSFRVPRARGETGQNLKGKSTWAAGPGSGTSAAAMRGSRAPPRSFAGAGAHVSTSHAPSAPGSREQLLPLASTLSYHSKHDCWQQRSKARNKSKQPAATKRDGRESWSGAGGYGERALPGRGLVPARARRTRGCRLKRKTMVKKGKDL